MTKDPLRDELMALSKRLKPLGIVLMVAGGYGLVLKSEYLRRIGMRTRSRDLPPARSTADIDCILTAEVISDAEKTKGIHDALTVLDYSPVPGAEYYQFSRDIEIEGLKRTVRFDFLAAPVSGPQAAKVKTDSRRTRPVGFKAFHAHTTPEALTAGEQPVVFDLANDGSDLVVHLPHPFSYLLLKLHVLRDQIESARHDYGRRHAFDVYNTVSMMTEDEWARALELREKYSSSEQVAEARRIVTTLLSDPTSLGIVRLREQARLSGFEVSGIQISGLISDLGALLLENT